jgi:hypothetical protein
MVTGSRDIIRGSWRGFPARKVNGLHRGRLVSSDITARDRACVRICVLLVALLGTHAICHEGCQIRDELQCPSSLMGYCLRESQAPRTGRDDNCGELAVDITRVTVD